VVDGIRSTLRSSPAVTTPPPPPRPPPHPPPRSKQRAGLRANIYANAWGGCGPPLAYGEEGSRTEGRHASDHPRPRPRVDLHLRREGSCWGRGRPELARLCNERPALWGLLRSTLSAVDFADEPGVALLRALSRGATLVACSGIVANSCMWSSMMDIPPSMWRGCAMVAP